MYWEKKEHPQFEVSVKALIYDDGGKLLVAKDEMGKWDLPGGRVDAGENIEQCLKREVKEELGVNLVSYKHKFAEIVDYDDNKKRLMVGCDVVIESKKFVQSSENIDNKFVNRNEFIRIEGAYAGLVKLVDKLFVGLDK